MNKFSNRPKPGQVWAFGSAEKGRTVTVMALTRGAVGSWRMQNGRLVPISNATAVYVKLDKIPHSITLSSFLKDWVRVK